MGTRVKLDAAAGAAAAEDETAPTGEAATGVDAPGVDAPAVAVGELSVTALPDAAGGAAVVEPDPEAQAVSGSTMTPIASTAVANPRTCRGP
jgi:hypothetical protein